MEVTILKEKQTEDVDVINATAYELMNLPEEVVIPTTSEVSDSAAFDYFKLGGLLNRINREKLWSQTEDESFEQFAKRKLGVGSSKAYYLIDIFECLVNCEVPWSKVEGLGWTKLRHMARVLSKENATDWIAMAEEMRVDQLQEAVRVHLGSSKENKGKRTLSLRLFEDEWETVNFAIEQAKKDRGTPYAHTALDAICMNYLSGGELATPRALAHLMREHTPVEVMKTFETIWPDLEVQAMFCEDDVDA